MTFVQLLFAIFLTLLVPADALAWGPGMHLELALAMVEKIAIIAPTLAPLLKKYRNHFIYGAVSPDIQVGKKYAGLMHHCHSWKMGHLILSEAKSDSERAAAYGYLLHLAADTVAHSYYVPYKIVENFRSTTPNAHIYWELRFDLTVSPVVWQEIDHLVEDHYEDVDQLLERVLKKTLFSFGTHKRIFRQILIMQKMKKLKKGLHIYDRFSRLKLSGSEVDHFRRLAYDTATDFLKNPDKAACLIADPIGEVQQVGAVNLRRRLRKALSSRVIDLSQSRELITRVRLYLEKGLQKKGGEWPDLVDVM